ncbi:hypothetical protein HK104_003954, partial [Borealophlyctis nickersoniae]
MLAWLPAASTFFARSTVVDTHPTDPHHAIPSYPEAGPSSLAIIQLPQSSSAASSSFKPQITPRTSSIASLPLEYLTFPEPFLVPARRSRLGDMLIDACAAGELETVRTLIKRGADVDASKFWDGDWVHLGLQEWRDGSGGDDNHIGAYFHLTPLNAACIHGRLEIVKELLANGADVHAFDDSALFLSTV